MHDLDYTFSPAFSGGTSMKRCMRSAILAFALAATGVAFAQSSDIAGERASAKAERARLKAENEANQAAAERSRIAKEEAIANRAPAPERIPSPEQMPPLLRGPDGNEWLQRAMALDAQDNGPQAVKAYIHSARAGNCKAVQRLGQIYSRGLVGIAQDVDESNKWYNFGRTLGCEVPVSKRK
jgi:hypothetical protein